MLILRFFVNCLLPYNIIVNNVNLQQKKLGVNYHSFKVASFVSSKNTFGYKLKDCVFVKYKWMHFIDL